MATMTPKQQTIAIAKACGWIQSKSSTWDQWWYRKKGNRTYHPFPPDYLNDLNAMHDAEKTLDPIRQCRYAETLYKLIKLMVGNHAVSGFMEIHVTAAQRAEAFLKTLNLWKL